MPNIWDWVETELHGETVHGFVVRNHYHVTIKVYGSDRTVSGHAGQFRPSSRPCPIDAGLLSKQNFVRVEAGETVDGLVVRDLDGRRSIVYPYFESPGTEPECYYLTCGNRGYPSPNDVVPTLLADLLRCKEGPGFRMLKKTLYGYC